jgi:hypothetical protein
MTANTPTHFSFAPEASKEAWHTRAIIPIAGRRRMANSPLNNLHLDCHRFKCAGVQRSRGRCRIPIVASVRDANVIEACEHTICRVKTSPAHFGNVELQPGVRCVRLCRSNPRIVRIDISEDVPRRNSKQTSKADKQIRKVLADPSFAEKSPRSRSV